MYGEISSVSHPRSSLHLSSAHLSALVSIFRDIQVLFNVSEKPI